MTDIAQHNLKASLGQAIKLYHIDLSSFGEPDIFLYEGDKDAPDIMFGGQPYQSWNVKATGFKVVGKGRLPTPRFAMGDHYASLSAYIASHDQLRGAVITRRKTYKKYLDGQPGADSEQTQPPEMYEIVRLESQKMNMVQWQLESFLANRGKKIPGRIIDSNYCDFDYRVHNGTGFDNPTNRKACPYRGTLYFDENDDVVTAAQDSCGKCWNSCKLRHPTGTVPFGGVPGAGAMG